MILLSIVIIVLVIIVTICLENFVSKFKENNFGTLRSGLSWILGILVIPAFIITLNLNKLQSTEEKIQLYQENNTELREDILVLAEERLTTSSTKLGELNDLKTLDPTSIIEIYPELKINDGIMNKIDKYVENEDKILEFQEEVINGNSLKWWLYFGE